MNEHTKFLDTMRRINNSPFQLGYRAYGERKGTLDNPYIKPLKDDDDTSDFWRWYYGWLKADSE